MIGISLLIGLLLQSAPAAAPDLFDQIVARGKAQQQTLKTIGARFTETTVSSLLLKPIVAKGTVVAERSGRLVMTYTSPDAKTLTVTAERLTVTWADPARAREELNIARTQKQVQKYFAGASPAELRRSFDIKAFVDPQAAATYQIDMTPTRKQIKEGLERLQLWIDRETTLLVKMRMSFPGGDSKTIELDTLQLNVPFPGDR